MELGTRMCQTHGAKVKMSSVIWNLKRSVGFFFFNSTQEVDSVTNLEIAKESFEEKCKQCERIVTVRCIKFFSVQERCYQNTVKLCYGL